MTAANLPQVTGVLALAGLVVLFPSPPTGESGEWGGVAEAGPCPKGMVSIRDKFCIDAYEAHTVEVDKPRTSKRAPKRGKSHSPFKPIGSAHVMAVSEKGKIPQGHISRDQAEQACINAGKRLCTDDEWLDACRGKKPTKFPYGDQHAEGRCNDRGVSGFNLLFGPGNNTPPDASVYTKENMNDPRLNQVEGSVAKAGSFSKCKNGFKAFDMVGNLHEWTSDPAGTFRGGYYLDTKINGEGCDYRTKAHDAKYYDYSTGFRCCQGGDEQKRIDKLVKERDKSAKSDKSAKADDKPSDKQASSKKKAKKKG
ncbi:MAG: SUMF1/EgtB/PvdO family nonheme iron enzyme [Polyangiaceae bacterium]|jgi:sulfatase modifying factor 1|nr:SUMF1/EgtB/PvdO family nonheme iron enzyme [Polyangiaceae bacterium]